MLATCHRPPDGNRLGAGEDQITVLGNGEVQAVGHGLRIERQPRRSLPVDQQFALAASHFLAGAGEDAVDAVALETIDRPMPAGPAPAPACLLASRR